MKGYPKFKAEIVDQSQIMEIETTNLNSGNITVIQQAYTSDKGTEEWEILQGFDGFTNVKGPISFNRHGQAQLVVAEILRAGGIVLGKRMVSDNATLANVTVRARILKVDNISYLYLYQESKENVIKFRSIVDEIQNGFDPDDAVMDDGSIDVPLFTVAPLGRGESSIRIRIVPEYASNRYTYSFLQYSFEVEDDLGADESIAFTMNPNVIINNVSQAMNPKIKSNSKQVQVQLYDSIDVIVRALAETATINGVAISAADLLNIDFINGYNLKGNTRLGNIVTSLDATEDGSDNWTTNAPSDIKDRLVDISGTAGISLINGSNGSMGSRPIKNTEEYTKMLLGTWGKTTGSTNYRPEIYDLDMFKVDATFDNNYPMEVKKQIINVAEFRGDMMYFADLNTDCYDLFSIVDRAAEIPRSRYVAIYHNFFYTYDPYTRREIKVTMPFLLATKMVAHINSGVSSPFAGIANKMTFDGDIIKESINFLPFAIPGADDKQTLVDNNVNYITYYDNIPTMDTMYTNQEQYTQLSYINNVMNVQQIIKRLRSECPRDRYTFVDGENLDKYLEDVNARLNEYQSQFSSLTCQYMYDEKYELNKIFYATLVVKFREFFDEEYFKIIAIN